MSKTMAAFLFGLALLASAPGCAPEVPAAPTFALDVKPIMMGRCTRCHGETLLPETLPDGGQGLGTPGLCHLNRYDSLGDCSDAGVMAGACNYGAGRCGASIGLYAISVNGSVPVMPPAPAPKLNDWEQDVLAGWLKNVDSSGMPAP